MLIGILLIIAGTGSLTFLIYDIDEEACSITRTIVHTVVTFFIGCAVPLGLILTTAFYNPIDRSEYAAFQERKEYIISHKAVSETEETILTAEKTEYNDWLSKERSKISFPEAYYIGIPDGFMEETPIN